MTNRKIESDKIFMRKALELAARGRGRTSPNPMVGAVIVKGGNIIAADFHRKAGAPHAEILALKKVGKRARGATLYISLEPCCHTDKRTPPCTGAIIQAGIKRVAVAMIDPNPKVSGMGLRALRKAGIETISGIMRKEALRLNEVFIKYMTEKKPFVILKVAQSLDGKIATAGGISKWITGEQARKHVHKLRNEVDAVLVGIGTVKKDNPSLDCRIKGGRNPYRIIADSSLDIALNARVLKHHDNKTIIATIHHDSERVKAYQHKTDLLKNMGVQVLTVKEKDGKVDLRSLMKKLAALEITSVMIEGGSAINASALSSGIVDKIMLFTAPRIIGGADAISSIGGESPVLLTNAFSIKDLQVTKIGNDLLLEGYL